MAQEFDILILGGGSAGYSAALRARQLGFTVGLVEKEKVGGTCLHTGCIRRHTYTPQNWRRTLVKPLK